MNILILGANGFIGSHLSEAILAKTDWFIKAIDLQDDKIQSCLAHPRFSFQQLDIRAEREKIKGMVRDCDVIFPLVAIATPALYVNDPLRVFELDFEANLEIVRHCVAFKKRLIFPSTSEVYGMCSDTEFDEEKSFLVTGPIHKERWIYATSKQLLDRLIYAYGRHHQLAYTLFRPFNWYGPRLDNIHNPKPGGSRVLSQFIGHILRGENINLVNGGKQQRCFTFIRDGIDALLRIVENPKAANGKIFNIGNPAENISIKSLAQKLLTLIRQQYPHQAPKAQAVQFINMAAEQYYGVGYQDVTLRVPAITAAKQILGWEPKISLDQGLQETLAFYLS